MARRTLASAAFAAGTGAASLCALVLLLNPEPPLWRVLPALVLCLFLPWALLGTLVLALLAALASAARWWARPFRPVVAGRPFFASLAFLALAAVAGLYWHNLFGYRHAIPVDAVRAIAASAVVLTGSAAVLVAIGIDLALFPRHERGVAAVLAILAPAASVVAPLALRPAPAAPQQRPPIRLEAGGAARRVFVVGLDGLSPSDLAGDPATARVPWLAGLARRGAAAPLATLQPTEGPPIWTTLLTGRLPRDHGIRSASSYRLLASRSDWPLLPKGAMIGALERAHLVARRSVPSLSRRRRALWNVLDAFGISSGLVRVWGTHPPEAIHGFLVSPYFHVLLREPGRVATTLYPRELLAEAAARAVTPAEIDPALLRELAEPPDAASPLMDPALRRLAEDALAPDLTYQRVGEALRQAYAPSFFVIAFRGYDEVGHEFYRYAHPEAFGNVSPDEARRYGRVLSGYAALIGRWVSELEKELRPGDVLVVVSGHGLEPTPLWRRLLGALTGTEVGTASHGDAPPGVIVAVGDVIRQGSRVRKASVLDVAPTLLYLMGLPVARDMEGRVLTELVDPAFSSDNPVTFIPSYESLAVTPASATAREDELPPLPDEQP